MAEKTYQKGGRDHLGPKQGAAETGKAVPRMPTTGGPNTAAQGSGPGKTQKTC